MSTSVKAALLLLVFACEVAVGEWPTAKLTIQVVDETGSSLGGTETRITFEKLVHVAGQWGSSPVKTQKGKTDSSGSFSAADAGSNHVSYGAVAAGYYPSNSSVDFEAVQNGKWRPWDSIFVLTLRKIIHPVPMYAKRLETKLP